MMNGEGLVDRRVRQRGTFSDDLFIPRLRLPLRLADFAITTCSMIIGLSEMCHVPCTMYHR